MWAFDEGRFGLKTWCRRRWCPVGHRPPWIVQDEYQWWWVYVAVEPAHGRCHVLLLPHVNGAWLQTYFDALRVETGEVPVTVVLDNAPSHHSRAITWPQGMTPMFLPPYSPELNPAEQVFRQLRSWLANRVYADLEELQEALITVLHRFWEDPQVVTRLTYYPWWQADDTAIVSLSS